MPWLQQQCGVPTRLHMQAPLPQRVSHDLPLHPTGLLNILPYLSSARVC